MYLGRVVEQGPVDAIFHAPRHPYTRALLRSIPSIHAPSATAAADRSPASIPHPYNRPPGLPVPSALPGLHARRAATGRCRRSTVALGEQHGVRCFLYGDAQP